MNLFMPIFSMEQKQICNITITINMPFKINRHGYICKKIGMYV